MVRFDSGQAFVEKDKAIDNGEVVVELPKSATTVRIKYEVFSHYLDFQVLQDSMIGDDVTLRGGLKWDRCCDWDTGDCMYHMCGESDVIDLASILKAVYALGPLIPAWDGEKCSSL